MFFVITLKVKREVYKQNDVVKRGLLTITIMSTSVPLETKKTLSGGLNCFSFQRKEGKKKDFTAASEQSTKSKESKRKCSIEGTCLIFPFQLFFPSLIQTPFHAVSFFLPASLVYFCICFFVNSFLYDINL